jgi:hypothetical protein
MSWRSYLVNREFVNEKTTEELQNATVHATREINLWLRERFFENRVFSSSYEVTENLEHILRTTRDETRTREARRRLKDYLDSVRSKFPDYDEITVMGLDDGRFASALQAVVPRLPRDWVKRIKADGNAVGEAYWDERHSKPVVTIAVPIKAASGRLLGVMVGTLNFRAVDKILKSFVVGETGRIHLVDQDGLLIVSSAPAIADGLRTRLPASIKAALASEEGVTLTYADRRQGKLVASVRRIAPVGWGVVAEIGYEEAYGPDAEPHTADPGRRGPRDRPGRLSHGADHRAAAGPFDGWGHRGLSRRPSGRSAGRGLRRGGVSDTGFQSHGGPTPRRPGRVGRDQRRPGRDEPRAQAPLGDR